MMKVYVMKVEEELMHTRCECLMKASFLFDVHLVIVTLKTKPLSPGVGSSKSIFDVTSYVSFLWGSNTQERDVTAGP